MQKNDLLIDGYRTLVLIESSRYVGARLSRLIPVSSVELVGSTSGAVVIGAVVAAFFADFLPIVRFLAWNEIIKTIISRKVTSVVRAVSETKDGVLQPKSKRHTIGFCDMCNSQ